MIKKIKNILYNPVYGRVNSLYGAGIFPFWIYIKYYGKPAYKLARRIGLNKYFSLMCANILGSLFHVSFFIKYNTIILCWFFISLILFSGIFYFIHKKM